MLRAVRYMNQIKNGKLFHVKQFKNKRFHHYKLNWNLLDSSFVTSITQKSFSQKNKFYKDIITFDIETTTIDKNINFMYVFMMCINGKVYYHYDWNVFIEVINYLKTCEKEFVIWVHNLSYEFAFIQSFFKWEKVFCTSPHKVIFCKTDNVTFRCTYFMTNLSLAKIPKVFGLPIKKMIGDLDYKKIRLPKITPLTYMEKIYCQNDVLILYYLILKMIETYKNFNISNLPYTSTGFTRKYLREKAKENKQYGIMRNIVKECSPTDLILYHMFQRAFGGGETHLNYIYNNFYFNPNNCDGIYSHDKTSFYPAMCIKYKFPRKFFKAKSEKFFELLKKDYAIVFDVCFYDIKAKTSMTYISQHKCSYLKNVDVDNGKIYSADILVTTITELDFDVINKFYNFSKMKIGRCFAAKKRYLPKAFVESVLDLYENKTVLKDVKGCEEEYQRLKALLNSLYGCCVTDLIQPLILYNESTFEFTDQKLTKEQQKEMLIDYKDNFTSLLLYQTGIYITAYGRWELMLQNWAIGEIMNIYNDTDSDKHLSNSEIEQMFEKFNRENIVMMKKACEYHKIDFKRTHPKDINGNEHQLGEYGLEDIYTHFKSLGSKRYIYCKNKKIYATIAGLPKQAAVNYLVGGFGKHGELIGPPTIDQAFDKFTKQMFIPKEISQKNTHYYTLSQGEKEFVDYLGNKGKVYITTGISLIPQEFEINLSKSYQHFLTKYPCIDGISHSERLQSIKNLTKVKTLWSDLNEI